MKFAPSSVAVAALTALSVVLGGSAYADTGQDSGPNRNQSRKQADKPATAGPSARPDNKRPADPVVKPPSTIRQDVKEFIAAFDAKAAAELERATGYSMSPAAQQAAFGGAVPTVGMGGLVPNARALAAYIIKNYPGVQAIGGVRWDPIPDHPSGRAIDIMIGSDMGLGDAINADVQRKTERFGVVYTLWRVADHFDHVHVTVS